MTLKQDLETTPSHSLTKSTQRKRSYQIIYVWELKAAKKPFTIKLSLLKKVPAYKAGSRRCNLYLEEKLTIMKNKDNALLNKRTELFTKCRHVTRYLVSNCK